MAFLVSRPWRIFLICWIVYSMHFATNVVREHYPAFSLVDHGTFRVDEYQGFHSDIFVHRDGHSVIGNQVLVSALAAIPLWVFDPVLDALERHSKRRLAQQGVQDAEYRTDKPNRVAFFRLVKERGLDLRFGAATVVTTAFFMAPLTALLLAAFYRLLRGRGMAADAATSLTFVFAFGTALFYRATVLGHNMFVMYSMFACFVVIWTAPPALSVTRRLLAGLFAGLTVATDYVGVFIIPLLFAYLVIRRVETAPWRTALRESFAFAAGLLPPVAFLLLTQWAMYGHPLYPGQYWMPNQNVYVQEGLRGFTFVDPELLRLNLFHHEYGMFTWNPVLLLALLPARYPAGSLVLPRLERRFVLVASVVLILFASSNQYARLQFNSGFRYLLPLVPFLMLALADHWMRWSARTHLIVAALAIAHGWVIAVYREGIGESWGLLFTEGPQLPWYRVLGMTGSPESPWLGTWWTPSALLGVTLVIVLAIWRYGARLEQAPSADRLEQAARP